MNKIRISQVRAVLRPALELTLIVGGLWLSVPGICRMAELIQATGRPEAVRDAALFWLVISAAMAVGAALLYQLMEGRLPSHGWAVQLLLSLYVTAVCGFGYLVYEERFLWYTGAWLAVSLLFSVWKGGEPDARKTGADTEPEHDTGRP